MRKRKRNSIGRGGRREKGKEVGPKKKANLRKYSNFSSVSYQIWK
jgi:hypothetical protein